MANSNPTPKMQSEDNPPPPQQPQPKGKGKKPFPRPNNKVGNGPPKGQFKTVLQTPLTNDPLWKDSFLIEGETGFVNSLPTKEFVVDASGYTQLVEQEYKAISDVDKYYAKSIPASAHAYYHHVLFWYQIALQAQKHGTSTQDQERLVQFVNGYTSATIAAGAGEYLAGLGDYEDATGVKHILVAPHPNGHGHFGRISHLTHVNYEHVPAPAFFLQRVLEDMQVTTDRELNNHWDIENLAPQANPARPRLLHQTQQLFSEQQ